MKEEDKDIYYASGESIDKIKMLPQVEFLIDKGYEVIYLTEYLDEFVIKTIGTYQDKKFMNVVHIISALVIFAGSGLSADLLWNIADIAMGGMSYSVWDMWKHEEYTVTDGNFTAEVNPHGARLFKITVK